MFKDSNVLGLTYQSGQEQGVTDADGRYTCETGADVRLSLGQVVIGSAECASLIMPPSMVVSGALADPHTLNITRFLMMLDQDGDASNGITISDPIRGIAEFWAQVNFSTADLDAELITIRSDAASVDGTPHRLPTTTEAFEHLQRSVSCAYAGVFKGPFTGDFSGAMVMVVGWRTPGFGFRGREFEWLAYDSSNDIEFSGGGFPVVELSARPVIQHEDPNTNATLTGRYVTPDIIAGSWELSFGNRRGSFELGRLGQDTGTFRFVGKIFSFRQEGVIALSLDDNVVTGEVYEVLRGRSAQISGSVDGAVMSLTTTGEIATSATGTVSYDQDGAPTGVSGVWSTNGEFKLAACRLN